MGIIGIEVVVGQYCLFYYFWCSMVIYYFMDLNLCYQVEIFICCNYYIGCIEICLFYLCLEFCWVNVGKLLFWVCFLFMVLYLEWFLDIVIVEMCGVLDDIGQLFFWFWLWDYFVDMDFVFVISLVGVGYIDFIDDLMFFYLFYICLLSLEVRVVISQVYECIWFVLYLLEVEGFCYWGLVDLFDVGFMVECLLVLICSVWDFWFWYVVIDESNGYEFQCCNWEWIVILLLIINIDIVGFRVMVVIGVDVCLDFECLYLLLVIVE